MTRGVIYKIVRSDELTQTKSRLEETQDGVHTLGTDYQTAALLGTAVHSFNDIYEFLLVLQHPVQFVIVTGTKIAHDMLVSEKVHDGTWVVQLYFSNKETVSDKR